MSNETRQNHYADSDTELGSKAAEGTATEAGIGGTIGAIISVIAAIGTSVLLPGLGLLVAGPLAGALVGDGAGGINGGLIGAWHSRFSGLRLEAFSKARTASADLPVCI